MECHAIIHWISLEFLLGILFLKNVLVGYLIYTHFINTSCVNLNSQNVFVLRRIHKYVSNQPSNMNELPTQAN